MQVETGEFSMPAGKVNIRFTEVDHQRSHTIARLNAIIRGFNHGCARNNRSRNAKYEEKVNIPLVKTPDILGRGRCSTSLGGICKSLLRGDREWEQWSDEMGY